jgi:biopolymer transport protein TolR
MAFNHGGDPRGMMADINVTPLVDVMLVLLIIFMVTAPMMTQGMEVALPQVDTTALRTEGENVVITLNSEGRIFIDENETSYDNLSDKIKRIVEFKNASQVHLRADQDIPYGRVAAVMGEVRAAGVNNLGLVTEPENLVRPPVDPGTDKDKEK